MDPVNEVVLERYKIAHGSLAALAWVVFFPAGAINIRLLPSRYAVAIHVGIQFFAYALFIVAAALGIHIGLVYNIENAGLLMMAHPIIGLTVFSLLFFQPILGYMHHMYFKKYSRRTVWSHAHVWLGRILITLAMINGGLGLKLSAPYQTHTSRGEIVYGLFAGIIWLVYMSAAVFGEIKKMKAPEARGEQPKSPSDSATAVTPEEEKRQASYV